MLSRCTGRRMQDGFCSISQEILNISIFTKFGTQKQQGKRKTKLELGDFDLIFKVTEVIQGANI